MSEKQPKVDKEMFDDWKQHAVTELVFSGLQRLRGNIESALCNEGLIMGEDAKAKLARLLGQREGIDLILNIKCEEIAEDEENTDSE